VDFHVPVRQGQLVELVARIVSTGRTSMKVEVELCLVALDAHGRPAPVPALPAPTRGG